jgi:hypothetical protein
MYLYLNGNKVKTRVTTTIMHTFRGFMSFSGKISDLLSKRTKYLYHKNSIPYFQRLSTTVQKDFNYFNIYKMI